MFPHCGQIPDSFSTITLHLGQIKATCFLSRDLALKKLEMYRLKLNNKQEIIITVNVITTATGFDRP